ncbi:hypothetical protein [Microcoleus sp. SVA1B1]|uniref:hypothetical protein n=1 Tax=Microcoleus sp. SVA1B1 TaxID=3055422 RepID=UPI002FD695FE
MISIPVASELISPEISTRQCRFPTSDRGWETALPCPLYHSGAAGIDMIRRLKPLLVKRSPPARTEEYSPRRRTLLV